MSRFRQFSFYPHALCIGLIPARDDLSPMDLTENEARTMRMPGDILQDGQLVRFDSAGAGRYGLGATLFLRWDEQDKRWYAFAVSHITTDFVDETNYARAYTLNLFIWKMLLDAFRVPVTSEVLDRIGELSPNELRALSTPH